MGLGDCVGRNTEYNIGGPLAPAGGAAGGGLDRGHGVHSGNDRNETFVMQATVVSTLSILLYSKSLTPTHDVDWDHVLGWRRNDHLIGAALEMPIAPFLLRLSQPNCCSTFDLELFAPGDGARSTVFLK